MSSSPQRGRWPLESHPVPGPRVDSKTARIPSRGKGQYDPMLRITSTRCSSRLIAAPARPKKPTDRRHQLVQCVAGEIFGLGAFSESYFKRINGRVTLDDIRKDYCQRYGDGYVTKFKARLDTKSKTHLAAHRRDVRSSYSNLIVWRNAFAHEGTVPATVTYAEVVQAYQDGKEVIHSLAASMVR